MEEKELITINIGNVANGAMVDAFQLELEKVIRNIMDPSTEATTKRKITLELELKPKEDRCQVAMLFTCTSKLASMIPVDSRMFIGKDTEGFLVPLKDDPRQMNIFQPPKAIEAPAPIIFSNAKK